MASASRACFAAETELNGVVATESKTAVAIESRNVAATELKSEAETASMATESMTDHAHSLS